MLEGGSYRAKNVVNIVFKNSMDACCAALSWWAIGWALAYGGDTASNGMNVFIGSGEFFLVSSGHFPNTAYARWFLIPVGFCSKHRNHHLWSCCGALHCWGIHYYLYLYDYYHLICSCARDLKPCWLAHCVL